MDFPELKEVVANLNVCRNCYTGLLRNKTEHVLRCDNEDCRCEVSVEVK